MDLNIGTVTCGTATPGVLDYLGILGLPQHTIEPHLWRVNHPEEKDIAEASDAGSQVLIEDAVRERAHQLFEQRGFEHGHDLLQRDRLFRRVNNGFDL